MKNKRLSRLLVLSMIAITAVFLGQCVPPADSGEDAQMRTEPIPEIDRDKCDLYLNFAYSYYQNQNWASTIKNYKKMMEFGCEKEYAQDIFSYYGRAYQQLAKTAPVYYDSALYVFQKGEKYLPNDLYLKKNIAYIYHVQGKLDLEIREYEKMIELQPEDIELYRNYIKLCFAQERYDDILWAVEKILKLYPNDEQAINDRRVVFERTGQNPITIMEKQWLDNQTNVRYGMEYAEALIDQLDYDKAITVLKKVTDTDLRNKEAWDKLADLYKTLGKYQEAAGTYEHINKNIDSQDLEIIDNISKMYISLANYETAYNWAKKAMTISNNQVAYKIRADVLFATAEANGSAELSFEDKLVYKLAYDDYLEAKKLGDYSSQSRIDFLKEHLIPSREDWFMNRYDASGKERTVYNPRRDCYKWIDLTVKKD